MARSTDKPARETLAERIDFLVTLSGSKGGKMPITVLVKTEAEAEEARKLLKRRKNVDHIGVRVDTK